ncbi:MAG: DUF559 domain-containing protein [Ignavibacteria bacterium]|nr:DUF559 domain-containing protein [Ignavibacteria bacterium]
MKREIIPYRKDLKLLARKLRKNMTLSEVLLWNALKKNQLSGYDFHRQVPVKNYILDFYCKELKLAIEIDGSTHIGDEKTARDLKRQKELENSGIKFLRFSEADIRENLTGVLDGVSLWIKENK